jgi:hypothetical protein
MMATKKRVEQAEQRRFSRVPLTIRAAYVTRDGRSGALDLGNVGVGGIGGRVAARLEPGTALVVHVAQTEGLREPVELVGRVRWQTCEGRDTWRLGIQLQDDECETPAGLDELMRAALRQAQEEDVSSANELRGVAVMKCAGNVWTIRFQPTRARR